MCGLFGSMSTNIEKEEVNKTTELGIVSMLRGTDATGMCVAYKGKDEKNHPVVYDSHKTIADAYEFLLEEKTQELLTPTLYKLCIMGHTRLATTGAQTLKCAHPHFIGDLIGCHNGTINKFTYSEEHKRLGSDSRVLYNLINTDGIDDALKEVGIIGAYALTYFDKKNHTLNFIRNTDRPLWLMYRKGRSTVYWASEKRFLDFTKNDSHLFEEPFLLDVHKLYTFKIGDPRSCVERRIEISRPFPTRVGGVGPPLGLQTMSKKARRKWLKSHRSQGFPSHSSTNTQTFSPGQDTNQGSIEFEEVKPGLGESSSLVPIIPKSPALLEYIENVRNNSGIVKEITNSKKGKPPGLWDGFCYEAWRGERMTPSEAVVLLGSGCDMCQQTGRLGDTVQWISRSNYICGECSSTELGADYCHASDRGRLVPIKDL